MEKTDEQVRREISKKNPEKQETTDLKAQVHEETLRKQT